MQTGMPRREVLRSAAAMGVAGLVAKWPALAAGGPAAPAGTGSTLSEADMAAVDAALAAKGEAVPEESLYTISLPRDDLNVSIHGEAVPIPFGFRGWVSFRSTRDGRAVMLMSDTVLLQEEVNPVISAAHQVEVTAIHNHFLWEEPRIFFMHLHATGTDVGP